MCVCVCVRGGKGAGTLTWPTNYVLDGVDMNHLCLAVVLAVATIAVATCCEVVIL